MRLLSLIAVLGTLLGSLAIAQTDSTADTERKGNITLLTTINEWKYPDSQMPRGASMSDGGYPNIQSVKCQTVLTTPDSFKKVVRFYNKKLGISPDTGESAKVDARAVVTQDDSDGRPVSIEVISIHKGNTSTTLVISRGEQEKETHIAWSHFIRIADAREAK
jgi:hypothetical protein